MYKYSYMRKLLYINPVNAIIILNSAYNMSHIDLSITIKGAIYNEL